MSAHGGRRLSAEDALSPARWGGDGAGWREARVGADGRSRAQTQAEEDSLTQTLMGLSGSDSDDGGRGGGRKRETTGGDPFSQAMDDFDDSAAELLSGRGGISKRPRVDGGRRTAVVPGGGDVSADFSMFGVTGEVVGGVVRSVGDALGGVARSVGSGLGLSQ